MTSIPLQELSEENLVAGDVPRADARMFWLLDLIVSRKFNSIVAWDEDVVDDFVETLPEAERTLKYYTLGQNSSPMLNRAANRAYRKGYLSAASIGNQDARSFNQRTWCRVWVITPHGRAALKARSAG